MAEERMMILNLLRDGKISATEAERLLHAVRETPPPPPAAPAPPPSLLGQATSLAGKALDYLPKPKVDTGKFGAQVSEAAGEAFKAAKSAARDVASEVGKITQQTRQALHFDGPTAFGTTSGRPANRGAQPEATETSHTDITWSGAEKLLLVNAYGNVRVTGQDGPTGVAQATTTQDGVGRDGHGGAGSSAAGLSRQPRRGRDVPRGGDRAGRCVGPTDGGLRGHGAAGHPAGSPNDVRGRGGAGRLARAGRAVAVGAAGGAASVVGGVGRGAADDGRAGTF